MMTILLDNEKGGVAKSTSTVHLAWALGMLGHHVVCIDWDPQGTLTATMQFPVETLEGSPVFRLLRDRKPPMSIAKYLWRYTGFDMRGSVRLLPNTIEMYAYDLWVVDRAIEERKRPDFLELRRNILEPLERFGAEYCLIDGIPGRGLRAILAVASCDYIIIPATPDFAAGHGLHSTLQVLFEIMNVWVKQEKVIGILPVMIPGNMPKHAQRWIEGIIEIANTWNVPVFQNYVPLSTRYKDALEAGKPIWLIDRKAPGAFAYVDAAKELVEALRRLQDVRGRTQNR